MLISRRRLISGAGAFAAYAVLREVAKADNGVLAGVIRFDPWYVSSGSYPDISTVRNIQNMVSPPQWQSLAPWFCERLGYDQVACNATQEDMDTEILCQVNAGFKYALFEHKTERSALGVAKTLFDNSPHRNLIGWGWMSGLSGLGSIDMHIRSIDTHIANFKKSNYMKVMSNRPLFFIFWRESFFRSNWGGSFKHLSAAITSLRNTSLAVGLGSPYIVIIDETPNAAVERALGIGADAISFYNQSFYGSFSGLAVKVRSEWNVWNSAAEAAGLGYIPTTVTGWDVRPSRESQKASRDSKGTTSTGVAVTAGEPARTTMPGTISEIVSLARACVEFTSAHSTTCISRAMNVCAWDENVEEGAPLIPTFADPLQPGNTNNILSGFASVLK